MNFRFSSHALEEIEKRKIPISLVAILRTELSGYNTVGEEIRIVWMGFNEGRVSASQTLLTQQFWGSSKTRRSSKVLHWGDEWD